MLVNEKKRVKIIDPEEFWMPLADYLDEHGDPDTNGKGHKREEFKGRPGVLMPSKKIYRIRREEELETKLVRVKDDGKMQLSPDHMKSKMMEIASGFLQMNATGQAINPFQVQQAGSAAAAQSSRIPPALVQPAPSAEDTFAW